MKNIFLFLLFFNTFINANFDTLRTIQIVELNEQVIESIKSNDYNSVKELLSNRFISASLIVDGKPLLVHAVINDKPDMVNLLIRYGAQPYTDYCDQGYNALEWAIKSESYYARAELIVITILNY
jgi:hypothetical protein|tara:strand:- start:2408 stop:2782 length:375 start_codon:yes stop_codon:yes gene_type:complete